MTLKNDSYNNDRNGSYNGHDARGLRQLAITFVMIWVRIATTITTQNEKHSDDNSSNGIGTGTVTVKMACNVATGNSNTYNADSNNDSEYGDRDNSKNYEDYPYSGDNGSDDKRRISCSRNQSSSNSVS